MALSDHDIFLFREGTHAQLAGRMGCVLHPEQLGAHFAVWAPNAEAVSVIGDWHGWVGDGSELHPRWDGSGIWEGAIPEAQPGQRYKFRIRARDGQVFDKADPYAVYTEEPPGTASRIWSLTYDWHDDTWMQQRAQRNALNAPISVYELHLGSWRRRDGGFLNYREIAHQLAPYILETGFTHVELMPVTEHPFYGSWGYQTTGYFAPTARYGTPQDLMYLIDYLHQRNIGVILDWVPSHFPTDAHGLIYFDGSHLYEHADIRQGFHPEWNSAIFNYGRNEVRSFLISSALSWLRHYHADGLRVDGVASMLYLDYARQPGQWVPNRLGGHENLEAIELLRALNIAIYREFSDTVTVAEESTAWPRVSRPIETGGLGFGMKWNMGWMHDTLSYFHQDPVYRKYHHGQLTFSLIYAFSENFMLPLSHDEVVYGKGSLIEKMPGDDWQKFANLRALYAYGWAHPGKKLLFMGGEFAQRREWAHEGELQWSVAALPAHNGIIRLVRELNRVYREEPALHELDLSAEGFEWVDLEDAEISVLAFLRKSTGRAPPVLIACNFTPVPRRNLQIGVPRRGQWREILNTDAREFGGSGWGNLGAVQSAPVRAQGRMDSVSLTLPPLSAVLLRWESHA